jgi:hypothetical protein
MDLSSVLLIVATMLGIGAPITAMAWYARKRMMLQRRAVAAANALGWQEVHRPKVGRKLVTATWNGVPLKLKIVSPGSTYGESNLSPWPLVILSLGGFDRKQRFYLTSRVSSPLYGPAMRPLRYSLTPRKLELSHPGDDRLFSLHASNAEPIEKLLSNPASRNWILRNVIEKDGELALEGGELRVIRFTRAKLVDRDPSAEDRLREILVESWDLLRAALAVLQPMKLEVTQRMELTLHCPFCKEELLESPGLVRCSECGTLHHAACWQENARCSVFGCRGSAMPYIKDDEVTEHKRESDPPLPQT